MELKIALLRIAPIALAACARIEAADPSQAATESDDSSRSAANRPPGEGAFWWIRVGEISSATVWFGPVVEDAKGRLTRYWTLNYASAGAPQPLVFFQSVLDLETADPIGAQGELFEFHLRPREGRMWHDVIDVNDIVVEAKWVD